MFEIGSSLREARERRRLGFAEAEQATKIRAKYLRALEDEQFDQLPSGTYIKGFLRAYAEYLGLDGDLYADEYTSRYSSGDDLLERRVRNVRPRPRRERRLETHVVWLALAVIGLVTALVIVAWRYGGGRDQKLPAAPLPRPAAARPFTGLAIKAVHGGSLLIVRKRSETGPLAFQGTLETGESLEFRPPVWLNVGTPENITMRLAGRRVQVGGRKPRSLIVTRRGITPAAPGT
jgi:hypothetical protein